MAISNGVDLVIELPTLYAISSAENFADGAIKILNSLGIVDYLSFGAETGDINILDNFAGILHKEPANYKTMLKKELDKGLSFPKARQNALLEYFNNEYSNEINYLSSPNNILGIEYLKALKKYNSNIKPVAITRFGPGLNDVSFSGNIASSTAIRNLFLTKDYKTIKKLVPESSYEILMENLENQNIVNDLTAFENEIIYILSRMSNEEILELPDISEGLDSLIKKHIIRTNNINVLIENLKSKRYTYTRIQRILLYALLGITKKDMDISKSTIPYIRVLGFNENGKKILSNISKNNPSLKVITSVKSFLDNSDDTNLDLLLNKDIFASNVFASKMSSVDNKNLDFTTKVIKFC